MVCSYDFTTAMTFTRDDEPRLGLLGKVWEADNISGSSRQHTPKTAASRKQKDCSTIFIAMRSSVERKYKKFVPHIGEASRKKSLHQKGPGSSARRFAGCSGLGLRSRKIARLKATPLKSAKRTRKRHQKGETGVSFLFFFRFAWCFWLDLVCFSVGFRGFRRWLLTRRHHNPGGVPCSGIKAKLRSVWRVQRRGASHNSKAKSHERMEGLLGPGDDPRILHVSLLHALFLGPFLAPARGWKSRSQAIFAVHV